MARFCWIGLQIASAMVCILTAGCSNSGQGDGTPKGGHAGAISVPSAFKGQYPIKVATTTGMVADLVTNVGGNHVEVQQIMGEGIDPHLYKASPGDVSMLNNADVIFYSGRNLEG